MLYFIVILLWNIIHNILLYLMKTMTVKNYIAYLLLYYYYYTTVCYKSEDRLYDDSF